MNVIRTLMNIFYRLTGWTPIGRRLRFISGEGPAALELDKQTCQITDVQKMGHDGPEALIVELSHRVSARNMELSKVALVPRHAGYGVHALATTAIATYVFPFESTVANDALDWNSMIAMMDVRICD